MKQWLPPLSSAGSETWPQLEQAVIKDNTLMPGDGMADNFTWRRRLIRLAGRRATPSSLRSDRIATWWLSLRDRPARRHGREIQKRVGKPGYVKRLAEGLAPLHWRA